MLSAHSGKGRGEGSRTDHRLVAACLTTRHNHVSILSQHPSADQIARAAADDALANSALAQSEQPGLTVRDVCVYQVSAYGQQLNARTLFRSTLPPTMLSQRPPAPREQTPQPMPIGLITFEGAPNDDIDVMLEFTSGRFVANWPPAARRSQRLLWAKLKVNADPTDSPRITPGHWLSRLRDMPRLYAHAEGHANRGLLYDAEIGHQPQLKVTFKDNQYSVENSGPYMVHDFTLYVPVADGKGWKVSAAKEAPGADKPPSSRNPRAPPTPSPSSIPPSPLPPLTERNLPNPQPPPPCRQRSQPLKTHLPPRPPRQPRAPSGGWSSRRRRRSRRGQPRLHTRSRGESSTCRSRRRKSRRWPTSSRNPSRLPLRSNPGKRSSPNRVSPTPRSSTSSAFSPPALRPQAATAIYRLDALSTENFSRWKSRRSRRKPSASDS
ncbi:MAG: hypothetical protein U0992_00505 [Planctomycetaceae bacterium]